MHHFLLDAPLSVPIRIISVTSSHWLITILIGINKTKVSKKSVFVWNSQNSEFYVRICEFHNSSGEQLLESINCEQTHKILRVQIYSSSWTVQPLEGFQLLKFKMSTGYFWWFWSLTGHRKSFWLKNSKVLIYSSSILTTRRKF